MSSTPLALAFRENPGASSSLGAEADAVQTRPDEWSDAVDAASGGGTSSL
nr:hypothetical protein [Microbacterium hydrocarbonoxydans]